MFELCCIIEVRLYSTKYWASVHMHVRLRAASGILRRFISVDFDINATADLEKPFSHVDTPTEAKRPCQMQSWNTTGTYAAVN